MMAQIGESGMQIYPESMSNWTAMTYDGYFTQFYNVPIICQGMFFKYFTEQAVMQLNFCSFFFFFLFL